MGLLMHQIKKIIKKKNSGLKWLSYLAFCALYSKSRVVLCFNFVYLGRTK